MIAAAGSYFVIGPKPAPEPTPATTAPVRETPPPVVERAAPAAIEPASTPEPQKAEPKKEIARKKEPPAAKPVASEPKPVTRQEVAQVPVEVRRPEPPAPEPVKPEPVKPEPPKQEAPKQEAPKQAPPPTYQAPTQYFGAKSGNFGWRGTLAPGAALVVGVSNVIEGGGSRSGPPLPPVDFEVQNLAVPGLRVSTGPPGAPWRVRIVNSGAEPVNSINFRWRIR